MRGCPDLISAGSVYLLDDFTYVQVTSVTASRIRYRVRRGSPFLGHRRGATPEAFRERVQALVEAAFFPDFPPCAGDTALHRAAEQAGLRAALRAMRQRRPFGIAGSDQT